MPPKAADGRRPSPDGGLGGFVPFPADRAASYRAAGYWSGRTLDTVLSDAARRWPDRLAVADAGDRPGHGGLSYAELDQRADCRRGAARPGHHARRPGTAPAAKRLPVRGCPVRVIAGGSDPSDVPARSPRRRVGHFAAVSAATGLVVADVASGFDYRPMARELVADHPTLRHVIVDGDPGPFVSWAQLCAQAGTGSPAPPADPGSPALLLVSGGTTGMPKLIPRTHDDYVFNATASAALCRLSADDVYLVVLAAGHNFPLACPGLLGAMTVGATAVFAPDPSPEAAFAAIERHGVTVTALVPALAKLWAQSCEWEPVTPKSLRLLQVGGSKLEPEDARRVRTALTPGLQQVFGMAEGLLNFTRIGDPPEVVEHTQGRPLCPADELRIVNADGEPVGPGRKANSGARALHAERLFCCRTRQRALLRSGRLLPQRRPGPPPRRRQSGGHRARQGCHLPCGRNHRRQRPRRTAAEPSGDLLGRGGGTT